MTRSLIERRLTDVGGRLRKLREELRIVDEQLRELTSEADDTRLRALVSETPVAEREHRDAQRHANAMEKRRAEVITSISQLESTQDQLLDRLTAERR